jgi:two-component system LytT family response regulator
MVIVGQCTGITGMRLDLARTRADVVFLDARARDEVRSWRAIGAGAPGCLVVIMSPVPSDAVAAFADGAAEFLLKPYSRARFHEVATRLGARVAEMDMIMWARRARSTPSDARTAPPIASPHDVVLRVQTSAGTEYVEPAAIDCITAAGYGARIHTQTGVLVTSTPLAALSARLNPLHFIRTHRGALVNVRGARLLATTGAAGGTLTLRSGVTVPVAKRRIAAVRRALAAASPLAAHRPPLAARG